MIVYTKLWDTMKAKGVSQYDLTTKHNISKSTIDRLRNNKPISIVTADILCNILDCDVSDIMEHIKQD
ncbi:MAG: helix-turn-helix transcriptional regulator [Clostridiales bacterium]|nr:helix-turn-helix transcriptional regulator [Candidatus Crickella equi]